MVNQLLITPAVGKKLIAKAIVMLPEIKEALQKKKIAVVAGTTNGFVAEEILKEIGQSNDFTRENFFRGITSPPYNKEDKENDFYKRGEFPGDVIIKNGNWEKGKIINEEIDSFEEGDIIFKGANALNLDTKTAGIYIGDSKAGTINKINEAVVGRRTELYLPVGLEKRITGNINQIASKLNNPGTVGPRMMVVNGKVITEIEAVHILTGAEAELVAAGGVEGAEGSYYLAISGNEKQVTQTKEIVKELYKKLN